MIIQIIFFVLGFVLLIKSADWLVYGASSLARKHHIPDLVIGLTIVAFGTSAPELVVNAIAAAQHHPDIVFGNVIGSNNFNLFLILGVAGMITPLVVQSAIVWREIPLALLSIVVLFILTNDLFNNQQTMLSRLDAIILLIFFAFFLFYVLKQLKSSNVEQSLEITHFSTLKIWVYIIIGLAGLIFGGRLIVNNAVRMAVILGISEKIIGLTIIAAGTSLPELATSVIAAIKKNNDIAVGNIIGSNIFNIFFILGISSLINPLAYDVSMNRDIYLLGFGTLILFIAMFTGKKKKLDRWEAIAMLLIYIVYTVYFLQKAG